MPPKVKLEASEAELAVMGEQRFLLDILARCEEAVETPGGYVLRFPGTRLMNAQLIHFVHHARRACPWASFELFDRPVAGRQDVLVKGPPEVVELIEDGLDFCRARTGLPRVARACRKRAGAVLAPLLRPLRCRPDFIVTGVVKGGTTALFELLGRHPQVKLSWRKEVDFFDLNYHRGRAWYYAHFPPAAVRALRVCAGLGRTAVGYAAPTYIFDPRVPARVARELPRARFLLILRDPVSRAYSHYQMNLRLGVEKLPFEEAVEAEEGRLRGEWERMLEDPGYISFPWACYSYLERGKYLPQIERWNAVFPPGQTLILTQEQLRDDFDATLGRAAAFLGLRPAAVSPGQFNRVPYLPMDPAVKARLRRYFEPWNERLFDHLGQRFDWGS